MRLLESRNLTKTKVIWQKAESLWQVYPTLRLCSPGGSIGRTVWPQFAIAFLAGVGKKEIWRLLPQISFPWGSRDPISHNVSQDPTSVPAKLHLNLSNALSRVHECDRRQTDRQKCVGIGEIARAARAIPPNHTRIQFRSRVIGILCTALLLLRLLL